MTKRSVRRHVHSAALSSSPSASTLSPLTVFPRPSRSIKQIWWSQNQNRLFSSFYAHNPQAFARATSPTCHDVEAAEVRRVYSLQQLETLRGPATSPLKNEDDDATYTLVPSQRLARLERLEAHLQEEQARLETRCVWTFRDTAISARLPIQFVVVAVNSILDAAIRDASAMWSQRYLSTFQLPPSVATAIAQTTKHLDHLDHLQRVNKSLKQPRLPHQQLHAYVTTKAQLAALHRQAMELQETFGLDREEHLQRCHMQWMDARARQADYKRYVELALRFQPLSEVDFNATPWPGRLSESRYHACAQRLGKFYATYGPLRRGKKKAAATRLQAFVRGCRDRRRYRPAMAMRQRSRRKLCCRTCIAWHDWTVKSIRAKRILGSVLASKQRLCFTRWQQFTNDMRRDKERRIKESLTRLLTNRTLAVFGRWRDHTRRCRRVCVLHARAVAAWRGHVFHKWHHGVHTIKLERLQALSCLRLQTRWRCVLAKRAIDQRRQEHKQAVVTIQKLRRGFQSRRQVNVDAIRQTQCDVYVERAVRLKREIAIASEARRRRHEMACLAAAEHDASVAEQAQQATKDGKRQLSKLARIERENHRLHDHGGFLPKYTMTKEEATAVVAQNELDKALESARDLARHDFRLKQPPRFACLHPHDLQASFATEEEYLTHVNCPCHGSVDGFHMALEQTPLDWLPSTLATASLLRLWAATQSVMHSPSACLLSAQPLADVMAVPLTSLPDDVAQALKDLKSSCLTKQVEPRTLLRQAALLRWCVLTQLFQLGGLPVVKIPSTADIYELHSRRYHQAKAVFYSSWAAKQYKLLLPHLQRDALKTLQTIGDNACQNIVHRRQRAMHWLHQRASFAFLLLIGRRAAQSVTVTNRARSQLWSFSTQAKNGHRQRRQTLTQLQRQRRHAYVRLDHAAWLAASASLSLVETLQPLQPLTSCNRRPDSIIRTGHIQAMSHNDDDKKPLQRHLVSPATTWIFVLFCLINMLNFIDRGIIPGAPTQFQYFIKETLNISIGDESKYLGLLASSFIASYAGFILLFGYLSIFIKPFQLVAIGLSVWCIAVAICGASKHANSFGLLLFGRILSGIGESSFQCIAPPFIDDHAPQSSRTLWLGVFFSCISVGTAIGYEYGAIIANSSWGWGWAFYWEAILMLPLVLVCLRGIPDEYNIAGNRQHSHRHEPLPNDDEETLDEEEAATPRPTPESTPVLRHEPFLKEVAAVCNNAVFLLTVFGNAAFTFSLAGLSVFGPMFLIGLGLFEKETNASIVFGSIVVLSGLIGTPLGGLALDRACKSYPHLRQYLALRQVFLCMAIGTSLALMAWCLLPHKLSFLVVFGVALTFLFATTSASAIIVLMTVEPSRRALAVGVNTLLLHLFGDVPSPIILGALKDTWAPHCGSIELDGQIVLNPDCAKDFHGLLLSLVFPLLWLIWAVLSYGGAAWLVQRRLRLQGVADV